MNLHQVLTGAVNAGDHCFAVGSVEGIAFTAYAAGCNIAILASNFDRVQIIPGICHGNVQVGCIDCSTDRGKIAAAYASQVLVYEPTPLVHHNSSHKLDYCWVKTGAFRADCLVRNLSWNLEGTRLLTGGDCIHMWHHNVGPEPGVFNDGQVQFQIGGDETVLDEGPAWQCVWKCKTAHPVYHLKFSPDGTLFASAGKADRLVKVWYENRTVRFPAKSFEIGGSMSSLSTAAKEDTHFSFIYVAHPRSVTGISWRKTSKYMPKVSVANMLVTSCRDNICRIWVQTVLPDDGLINLQQFDPMAAQNPKYRMHRHKQKFMVRLKHMKTCFHFRRRHANQGNGPLGEPIPSLPSTFSAHDFHSFGLHGVSITPGFHFHLAASINAETDIPLVPSISGRCDNREPNFVLHWLNNKEMHFTLCAEQILQELCRKAILQENVQNNNDDQDMDDGENGNDADQDDDGLKESGGNKKKSKRAKLRGIGNFVIRSKSAEESDPERSYHSPASNPSTNSTASSSSISTDLSMGATTPLGDALDRKIEALLRDWHHSPDLLFSVHPVDGSYLVWLVDWLDEYSPSSFRQAQVSFSSRIPNALPLGDAVSMSPSLALYNCRTYLDLRDMLHLEEENVRERQQENNKDNSQVPPSPPPMSDTEKRLSPPAPVICMLSKHSNGTLNLWHVMFNEDTRFSQVLSVSHQARVCGHRFRVNDITCHPVLPLLLTTSHHNLLRLHAQSPLLEDPDRIPEEEPDGIYIPEQSPEQKVDSTYGLEALQSGFCSELILWRVDPVGPLCKSGGVTELARINSPEVSAFANVAWIPTLLPSTTLGSISNSPSACFVASDGQSLRVYQAVIDARTLLAEVFAAQRKNNIDESLVSLSSSSSVGEGLKREALKENFSIVSQQSTSRPGCIIQLGAIADATHDWQNTQLLHVFQEQLITGERTPEERDKEEDDRHSLMEPSMGAIVDLHHSSIFKEPFYLVVLEKDASGRTVLHMWRIVIASQPGREEDYNGMAYAPDSNIVQDSDHSTASSPSNNTADMGASTNHQHVAPVSMTTTKVCTQVLPLPDKVEIIHSCPAAGHLSSSSIYPACFAPYLISTACSDSMVRFWRCKTTNSGSDSKSQKTTYEWVEWEMMNKRGGSSAIEIQGKPLNVSCAYSGRIACAYKLGRSFTRPSSNNPNSRYVNLCIGIYECELTGGSGWVREDTIHLKNISLPDMGFEMDMRYVYDNSLMVRKKQSINNLVRTLSHEDVALPGLPRDGDMSDHISPNLQGLVAVPSFSTLHTLRKTIWEKGNRFPLTQKHLVQLDWVSTEDGSHMLTVGVGSKILLFTAVGGNVAQSNLKAMQESKNASRPLLKKASSMAAPLYNAEEVRWMKVRSLSLVTADGLPPLPMQLSWVRDGICVVGMDNEMHVYSQWKPTEQRSFKSRRRSQCDFEDGIDDRTLTEKDLIQLAHESSQRRLAHVRSLNHISSANLVGGVDAKKKRELISKAGIGMNDNNAGNDVMFDYGLFEASRIACPVLPQYHPKQLMELLNFGKIRRVKAILCHLVRCLAGSAAIDPLESRARLESSTASAGGNSSSHQKSWSRSRTLSISVPTRTSPGDSQQVAPPAVVPEELQLDYMEINAIPSLPLSTLLAADREVLAPNDADTAQGYSGLFDNTAVEEGDVLDDILSEDAGGMTRSHERRRSFSNDTYSLACFGPRQTKILTRLLTHTHLPGLSSLDQMYLLALAETVATFNTEFSDKFSMDSSKRSSAHVNRGSYKMKDGAETDVAATDLLDDCGLRFLLAMRHRAFLMRCLPMTQRAQLQKQGLPSANLVWAFHSEAQEELINMIPSMQKNAPKWSDLRELGVGWWASSNATLRRCLEKVAKTAFQLTNDPLDAALYYLAMRKKNIVWGLFRSVKDNRMTSFFQNDFTEPRWRQAALKNAFALLGKQRFYHAAAFFLLSGSLSDAVEVCLNKLDDLQLAMVLVRLYEGDMDPMPASLQRLLFREILGCDDDGSNHDPANAHPDPFLRSVAFWQLKDYPNALGTLLQSNVGTNHSKMREEDCRSQTGNPNVFNFYLYLRTHPLVIRRQIATTAKERKISRLMLSGFSHSAESKQLAAEKPLMVEDAITQLERRLYFTTAHAHFKGGCPLLALEVLSKLPGRVLDEEFEEERVGVKISPTKPKQDSAFSGGNTPIDTGIIGDALVASPSGEFDWSQPVAPKKEEELDLRFEDEEDEDSSKEEAKKEAGDKFMEKSVSYNRKMSTSEPGGGQKLDIMAQQLKFIACLKIMMEELSTLATGFEVDGGQLRYQLYVWLEQEVDALREICNYGGVDIFTQRETHGRDKDVAGRLTPSVPWRPGEKPTLHEILLSDKYDFEAKLERAERRRRWLRANQTLLRTLLSYCSLHGASGGGLASVHMELILLLQELHQEKTQRQLLSPLPFPTTLPLLSASVACHKTVVTDPIRHLQSMTHDILHSVVELPSPPIPGRINLGPVFVFRDLSIALSACIYQTLCDSDSFSVGRGGYMSAGMEALASTSVVYHDSHLMASRRQRYSSSEEPLEPTTAPNKWPGVTSLRALLAREKDEDVPKLTVLLCETFVAVYMSLLVHAMATCEAHTLYRLVGQRFTEKTWAVLFGGGAKRLLKVAVAGTTKATAPGSPTSGGSFTETGLFNTLSKQRMKLHMKILGPSLAQGAQPAIIKEDRPTYREQFVPPDQSMVSCFMTKPQLPSDYYDIDYDSSESIPSEEEEELDDDEDDFSRDRVPAENCTEHSDPNSYSWSILRYAVVRLVQHHLQTFLNVAGMELQELPVASPLIHSTLRVLDNWLNVLKDSIDGFCGVPEDLIPGCVPEKGHSVPAIQKYRAILEPHNTPFKSKHWSTYPVRRLWLYLVHQESVQEIFIRYVFGKKKATPILKDIGAIVEDVDSNDAALPDPIRIIHKDQDSISAFCMNKTGTSIMALATTKEVQELDISVLLEPPSWLECECEYDLLNLRGTDSVPAAEYLVVQTAADRPMLAQMNITPSHASSAASSTVSSPSGTGPSHFTGQTGRATTVLMKHRVDGVRRMSAHPLLPVYLTGSQDGSVRIWEWGHNQPLATPRPPGTYAKVTRVLFNPQGNKFGVSDGDGNLSLWQLGLSSSSNKAFFSMQCHTKQTSDFVFVGSSSLLATAGHSSESKNVCLWDTLLPQKKALIHSFTCHEQGSSCVLYAPQHQVLISSGKKGFVCIFDVRQRQMRHRFQAHEGAVKCMALDQTEEFFVTGSADGDIKVWGMALNNVFFNFPGEHVRNTFFRNIGIGVSQLYVDTANRLFSCGADGSMKLRQLPERELVVSSYYQM